MDIGLGSLIGGGVSAIGNLISSGVNYRNQRKLQQQQNEYNKQMAEWQNQVNIQNWQMENEYNTPANQIKRLQEAGLNPNLMYGNGSAATGNASSPQPAAGYESASAEPYHLEGTFLSDSLRTAISIAQLENQNELAQSQIGFQNAQEALLRQQTANEKLRNDIEEFNFAFSKDTRDLNYRTKLESLNSIIQSNNESQSRIENMEFDNEKKHQDVLESAMRMNVLKSQLSINDAQASLINMQTKESAQRIVESLARVNNINEDTRGKRTQNDFNDVTFNDRVDNVNQLLQQNIYRTKQGTLELNIKQFEHDFEKATGMKPSNASISGFLGTLYGRINNAIRSIGYDNGDLHQ